MPLDLPRHQLGFVSPLDVMDTQIYELYQISPPEMIASFISVGLTGFSAEAVEQCLADNLERSVDALVRRGAQLVAMGAIPMEIYISPARLAQFHELSAAAPLGGITGLDAMTSAFQALGARRIAIASKWSDEMIRILTDQLAARGFEVVHAVSEPMSVDAIKGDVGDQTSLARDLGARAAQESDADCVWLAGGAWLTMPVIPDLEATFGRPFVGLLPALNWYCLNRLGTYEPRRGHGAMLERRATL